MSLTEKSGKPVTVTLQVDNSDNKLTQQRWSKFIYDLITMFQLLDNSKIHFFGSSSGWSSRQTVAWIFETDDPDFIKDKVQSLCRSYDQSTTTWTVGTTEFI